MDGAMRLPNTPRPPQPSHHPPNIILDTHFIVSPKDRKELNLYIGEGGGGKLTIGHLFRTSQIGGYSTVWIRNHDQERPICKRYSYVIDLVNIKNQSVCRQMAISFIADLKVYRLEAVGLNILSKQWCVLLLMQEACGNRTNIDALSFGTQGSNRRNSPLFYQ